MSPLQIEIALHYFSRGDDYRTVSQSPNAYTPPAIVDVLALFVDSGLLRTDKRSGDFERKYHPTEALRVYVNAVCAVPLPVQQWVIPQQGEAA